ncbi:hypothetical protein L596_025320 [Steinernema carpocapsae]|uniref:Uncharacterized protein n=2 Tax=Steinernema carpocapsae TaxID=34508 RepID=A0A4U5M7M1_STECR|nr:hypothetical protein L596_025320 [Steinernema carpocapsae]
MAIQYPTALYALNSTTYSNPKDQPASYKARPIMTIHGLWINQALKIKPTTTVPPVTPPNLHEMERVWPNVELSNSNANFWAREFLKHHDTLNQKEYFNKALRLFEKINKNLHVFPNVFPNEKILDDVTYKCAFLNHYLGSINNVFEHPTLVCDNTTNVFKELRVCYDQYDKRKQCKNQGTTCDHNQNIIFLKPL